MKEKKVNFDLSELSLEELIKLFEHIDLFIQELESKIIEDEVKGGS